MLSGASITAIGLTPAFLLPNPRILVRDQASLKDEVRLHGVVGSHPSDYNKEVHDPALGISVWSTVGSFWE
jgi:hypothetical protein